MRIPALLKLIVSRALSEKVFLVLRAAGLTIAVGISAGVFIYLDGLGQSALNQIVVEHRFSDLNIAIRGRLDSPSMDGHRSLMSAVEGSSSGEFGLVTNDPVTVAKSITLLFDEDVVPWKNARAFFSYVGGIRGVATIVEGAWPGESPESGFDVAISDEDARYSGLDVGDVMELSVPGTTDQNVVARISGIYERTANSPAWTALDEGLIGSSTAFRFVPLIVTSDAITSRVASELPETELRYYWIFETDRGALTARKAEQILSGLEAQETALRAEVAGFQRITSLDDVLANFIETSTISRSLMLAVGAVISLSSLAFAALVAGQAREVRTSESGMLRARGATAPQEIVLMTGESILIALVALAIGVSLALIGVSLSGRLPGLSDLTGGELLPVSLSTQSMAAALGATIIGFASLLIPSIVRNVATAQEFTSRLARPARRNVVQRYYLDVALLGVGGAALWQISQEDLFIASSVLGEGFSNRLAIAMPAAIAAGGSIVLMRFLPFVLSMVADGLSRLPSGLRLTPAIPLALWSLARNPRSSIGLMSLIILAAAIAVLLAVFSPSIERYSVDEARYRIGSDFRISQMIFRSRLDMASSAKAIRELEKIDRLSTVARVPGTAASPEGNQAISIVGIVPDEFDSVAWWRSDLSDESLDALVASVEDTTSSGIPIPADAAWLTARIKPDTQRSDAGLVARLRDARGRYHSITIGNLEPRSVTVGTPFACSEPVSDETGEGFLPPEWCRIGFPLTRLLEEIGPDAELTLDFIGISRRRVENAPAPTFGSMLIDDITTYSSEGDPTVITDFQDILETRTAGPGFGQFGARIDPVDESGEGPALLTWSQPDFRQLKGIKLGTSENTLKVIGNRWFKDELDLSEGDTSRIFFGSQSVDAEFVAFTDFFPTFGSGSAPYIITDIRKIWEVVSIDDPTGNELVNEYWISGRGFDDATFAEIGEILDRNRVTARLFQNSAGEVNRSENDALSTLGWNSYLSFGFLAVTAVSALAFMVNGWTTYRLRRLELAVLKSMGLTMRQLLIMIGIEQTLIAAIALMIGASFGMILSKALLPYLAGQDASTLAPPMVLDVGWSSLSVLLGAIGLCLVAAITWVFLWVRSQQEHAVLRAGGAAV